MATAIVIGLGTTGLNIVEELQQFHYQFTGENKSTKVEYLYCETDLDKKPKKTANGKNDIKYIPLSLGEMQAGINRLKGIEKIDSWLPTYDESIANGKKGAAGRSAYGRLALWMRWNDVKQAISTAWHNIEAEGDKPYIFITGSLTGGTCTGTFIDIAYLTRKITQSDKIYGLFLIPGFNESNTNAKANYLIATAALTEFSKKQESGNIEKIYDVVWPDERPDDSISKTAPYSMVDFLSPDYSDGAASIPSKDAGYEYLAKIAGLNMCLNILDIDKEGDNNLTSAVTSKQIDINLNNGNQINFSTLATTLIRYPKRQLIEYVSLQKCKDEILNRWTDKEKYKRNSDDVKIESSKKAIKEKYEKKFELLLQNVLNRDFGVGNKIKDNVAQMIINKNIDNDIKDYFISTNDAHHYKQISNSISDIKDELVDGIYLLIKDAMEEFQNLHVLSNIISDISLYIPVILEFWLKKYKLDGVPSHFDEVLYKFINKISTENSLPSLLFNKSKYYEENMNNMFMLCKMHFTVKILSEIKEYLDNDKNYYGQKYSLPTKSKIEKIINTINGVIVSEKSKDQSLELRDITRRLGNLETELKSSKHFISIYKENFEKEVAGINERVVNKSIEYYDIKLATKGNSFEYLFQLINDSNAKTKLFDDIVEKGTEYVKNKITGTANIIEVIKELKLKNSNEDFWKITKRYLEANEGQKFEFHSGMIKLVNGRAFDNLPQIKRIFLNSDIDELRKYAGAESYLKDISTNSASAVSVSSLNEAIVIYKRFGFMGENISNNVFDPIKDIDMNRSIKSDVKQISDLKPRCPYLDAKKLQSIINTIE